MRKHDSSLTRVQPVFNELLDRWRTGEEWLSALITLAARTRREAQLPAAIGHLLASETPIERISRKRVVFERVLPPPKRFLDWLLRNPGQMRPPNPETYDTRDAEKREWRR